MSINYTKNPQFWFSAFIMIIFTCVTGSKSWLGVEIFTFFPIIVPYLVLITGGVAFSRFWRRLFRFNFKITTPFTTLSTTPYTKPFTTPFTFKYMALHPHHYFHDFYWDNQIWKLRKSYLGWILGYLRSPRNPRLQNFVTSYRPLFTTPRMYHTWITTLWCSRNQSSWIIQEIRQESR